MKALFAAWNAKSISSSKASSILPTIFWFAGFKTGIFLLESESMNLPSIKNFGKYGLESIAIIVSVLFSFYLEDLRVTNEKTNYKNELVKNLKAIIN